MKGSVRIGRPRKIHQSSLEDILLSPYVEAARPIRKRTVGEEPDRDGAG